MCQGHAYANPDAHFHSDRNAYSEAYAHAHANASLPTDAYSHSHTSARRLLRAPIWLHPISNAYGDVDTYPNAETNAYVGDPHSKPHRCAHPYGHLDVWPPAYVEANSHSHSTTHCHSGSCGRSTERTRGGDR